MVFVAICSFYLFVIMDSCSIFVYSVVRVASHRSNGASCSRCNVSRLREKQAVNGSQEYSISSQWYEVGLRKL